MAEPVLARCLGQVRLVDEGARMAVRDNIDAEALLIGEFAPDAEGAVMRDVGDRLSATTAATL